MKRLIIDIDETISRTEEGRYSEARLIAPIVDKIRQYKAEGFEIVFHSSRNMRTYGGNVGQINIHTLPGIVEWLKRHDIHFDEVYVGKPWCGFDGFYVDDKAVRPDEFARLSYDEVQALLADAADRLAKLEE